MSKDEKQSYRREAGRRVLALTRAQRAAASRAIVLRLSRLPVGRQLVHVLGFVAREDEPDLSMLPACMAIRWHLPCMVENRIIPRPADGHPMRPGWRGIPEPDTSLKSDAALLDAVLVPGRAFAPDGSRLGRGGGHYDALLSTLPEGCLRVGIAFECQIFPSLPRESHDIPMHWILTEHRAMHCTMCPP